MPKKYQKILIKKTFVILNLKKHYLNKFNICDYFCPFYSFYVFIILSLWFLNNALFNKPLWSKSRHMMSKYYSILGWIEWFFLILLKNTVLKWKKIYLQIARTKRVRLSNLNVIFDHINPNCLLNLSSYLYTKQNNI